MRGTVECNTCNMGDLNFGDVEMDVNGLLLWILSRDITKMEIQMEGEGQHERRRRVYSRP
jgi:hypothetical protein